VINKLEDIVTMFSDPEVQVAVGIVECKNLVAAARKVGLILTAQRAETIAACAEKLDGVIDTLHDIGFDVDKLCEAREELNA
jgi:hypothetical protein